MVKLICLCPIIEGFTLYHNTQQTPACTLPASTTPALVYHLYDHTCFFQSHLQTPVHLTKTNTLKLEEFFWENTCIEIILAGFLPAGPQPTIAFFCLALYSTIYIKVCKLNTLFALL